MISPKDHHLDPKKGAEPLKIETVVCFEKSNSSHSIHQSQENSQEEQDHEEENHSNAT
jgi:hypothetical protein